MPPDHVPGRAHRRGVQGRQPDVESSRSRVDKFAEDCRTNGTSKIVDAIPDAVRAWWTRVLIESVDGRVHLEQARQVIAAHKPLFIDKPLASTLEDARDIAKLAKDAGVPWFSSSSLRFGECRLTPANLDGRYHVGPGTSRRASSARSVVVCDPSHRDAVHADGHWLRRGDAHVDNRRRHRRGAGRTDASAPCAPCGRTATMALWRSKSLKARAATSTSQSIDNASAAYAELVQEIVKFLQTKQPPVSNEETLEIFAFMDAAQRSKEAGGKPTHLR